MNQEIKFPEAKEIRRKNNRRWSKNERYELMTKFSLDSETLAKHFERSVKAIECQKSIIRKATSKKKKSEPVKKQNKGIGSGNWKRDSETKDTVFSLRIKEENKNGIKEVAKRKGVSVSKLLVNFINEEIKKETSIEKYAPASNYVEGSKYIVFAVDTINEMKEKIVSKTVQLNKSSESINLQQKQIHQQREKINDFRIKIIKAEDALNRQFLECQRLRGRNFIERLFNK